MPDVTITLTNDERWALDTVAVFAIENRPMPEHFTRDGSLRHHLATASAKLRAAAPAAPGPLERLEAWLRANINDELHLAFYPPDDWQCGIGEQYAHFDGDDLSIELDGQYVTAPTLAAAVEAALAQVEAQS